MATRLGEESPAVQAHLAICQSIIQRMASNSATVKAWCVALVSAILVVVADKGRGEYVPLAGFPVILFLVMDAYYLGLERAFIDAYNDFIDKVHKKEVEAKDLYVMKPKGSVMHSAFGALGSFSIWPFYLVLGTMVYLARTVLGRIPAP